MTIVTVVIDTDKLREPDAGAILVTSVSDYATACLKLRDAMEKKHPLTLNVANRSVGVWLSDIARQYDDSVVRVCVATPESILAERWLVTIPTSVTSGEIRQSRLLSEDIVPREGQGFWDVLLERFYGDGYSFLRFQPSNLPALLNADDLDRRQDAAARPLVLRAFQEKLQQWEKSATQDAAKILIRQLEKDPDKLRRDLCHYKALRNYPVSLGRKVLGETWDVFRKLHVDPSDLTLSGREREMVAKEVEYYLTSQRLAIQSPDDLEALLDQMSGCLTKEYDFAETTLLAHLDWLSDDLMRKMESVFRALRGQIGASLTRLRRLLRPVYPTKPEWDWTAAQWLTWASTMYMPYYAWLEAAGQPDEMIKTYATTFADWYYEHFNVLKNSEPNKFAFTALYGDHARMIKPDVVTLIILIDNFNYVHFPELVRQFNRHDFTVQSNEPLLSLIPTATEVGKASLIASYGDQADLPSDRYPILIDKEWTSALKGKSAAYLPHIGELRKLKTLTHDVYFLNYLAIDKALHEDTNQTGKPHAEAIQSHLQTLTDTVADFARRLNLEDRLVIYTLSDHGSTRIAQETVNVLDQNYFKKLALEKHHRFVALSDEAIAGLPQMAEAQCYVIDRKKFKTNHNYLAAKSYYRFLETSDTFYVHGGLTPEEVVVPFARFEAAPVKPNPPTLRLLKSEYRYAKRSPVEFEIGNPNPYALESVSIRIVDQDSEEATLDNLAATSAQTIGLPTIFRKVPGEGNGRTITVHVRFECQGRDFPAVETQFDVTLKSLMEVTDDFEL